MFSHSPPAAQTHRTDSQLPIAWYLDPQIFELEKNVLFANAPQYVGHQLMVPHTGDYHTLDWMHHAKSLINQSGEISLISNVCRHRQAIMMTGSGNTNAIVCPLHRWTYDLSGQLLGAPHFAEKPCLHLSQSTLQNWQGLLFDVSKKTHHIASELAKLNCKQDFDFTDYHLDRVTVEHYQFGWKTFIETYLEDYHVETFHPGLNQFVDCDNLHWDFGDHFSAQTVSYKANALNHQSKAYQQWQQVLTDYFGATKPKHGAIWFVYYPYLMIEWYPNVLVVSHLIPTGLETCSNVTEFYYPEDIALFEREYVKAQQAAYAETAIEDTEICQRMHNGRKALYAQGIDERGPYQHTLEAGLAHFHQWYRKQIAPHLPADYVK